MTNKPQFIDAIEQFVEKHNLIPENSTLIVGLSGGPDSVFLLHLLAHYRDTKNISLIAATLDHEWRADSDKDVTFCKTVCQNLNIPFVHKKASELNLTVKPSGSQEEMGRTQRRFFLEQVRVEHNADLIALGQHEQDQQETFFIRLIRGTTLSGLIGMRPRDGYYIRPLLETNKADILAYLDTNKIDYLIDPTNVSQSFLRNRIRKNVLPALRECDERFDKNFVRTLHNLQDAEQLLHEVTKITFEQVAEKKDGVWHLDRSHFQYLNPYLQNRIIMHWLIESKVPFTPTEPFLDEIKRFLFACCHGTEHQLGPTWKIVRSKDLFSIVSI